MADRKQSLLNYIEQLKKISDSPVEDEDLYAAGFSENDLESIGWFQKETPTNFEAREGDSVQPYEPTMRDNLRENVRTGLLKLGLDDNLARELATSVSGEENPTDGSLGLGLADLTPMGIPMGVQEGAREVKRGVASGNAGTVASGVLNTGLNLASAIPGTKAVAKGVSNLAERAAENYDPTVVSAFGATHKVPRYKKPEPKTPVASDDLPTDETFDDEGFLRLDDRFRGYSQEELDAQSRARMYAPTQEGEGTFFTEPDPFAQQPYVWEEFTDEGFRISGDGIFSDTIKFRDPLVEVFEEMEIPNKGLKGSELAKQLQDNPTVRNSHLTSLGIFDRIDPQKRYTREEIGALLSENTYQVRVVPQTQYQDYQRQYDLVDKETGYTEYAIDASPVGRDQPNFEAYSQHYGSNTLAHVRLSDREGKNGPYVLIEELQSDLLQKGFKKPVKDKSVSEEIKRLFADPSNLTRHLSGDYSALKREVTTVLTPEDIDTYRRVARRGSDYSSDEEVKAYNNLFPDIAKRLGWDWSKDSIYNDVIWHTFFVLDDKLPFGGGSVAAPPIAKTEEAVRLSLETAMAHGAKNGVTKVVIPPLKKIVEKRFSDEDSKAKAMDPKSGFFATYINATNKVLKDLQAEFGDKIKINKTDLEYDPNKKEYDFGPPMDRPDLPQNTTPGMLDRFYEVMTDRATRRDGRSSLQILAETPEGFDYWNDFTASLIRGTNGQYTTQGYLTLLEEGFTPQEALNTYFKVLPEPVKAANVIEEGLEIDFSGAIKEGYDLTKPKFAKGGLVLDPVSKNVVPPGSKPEEVRDNVDAKLSEGEYVIPADVVRFLGLDKIEKLVSQAKESLSEMASKGRIGGERVEEEDDLPFSDEELMMGGGELKMAEGGLVPSVRSGLNAASNLPPWLLDENGNPKSAEAAEYGMRGEKGESPYDPPSDKPLTEDEAYTARTKSDFSQWQPEDFEKFTDRRANPMHKLMEGVVSMVPLGGLVVKAGTKYANNKIPKAIDSLLSSGVTADGTPLTPEQVASLNRAKEQFDPNYTPGLKGLVKDRLGGIIQKRDPAEREARQRERQERRESERRERPDRSSRTRDDDDDRDNHDNKN